MARGGHKSPQFPKFSRRWKSRKKDIARIKSNEEVIRKLYAAL